MSWKEKLLDATYRGVALQVMSEDMDGRRALAPHGMPYRDGNMVEDMGREESRFDVRVVFFGDDYEIGLQQLIQALRTPGEAEFVHPVYGSVTVVAESWRVSHSAERPDYADVALVLVESEVDPTFFDRVFTPTEGALAAVADDGPSWQDKVRDLFGRVDGLVTTVQGYIGGGWVGLAEQLSGLPGIGVRLGQLRSQAQGVIASLDSFGHVSVASFDPLVTPERVPTEIRAAVAAGMPYVPDTSGSGDMVLDVQALRAGNGLPTQVPGDTVLPAIAIRAWSGLLDAGRRGVAPVLASSGDAGIAVDIPQGMPSDPQDAQAFALVVLGLTEQALATAEALATVLDAEMQLATLAPQDIELLLNQARALLEGAILLHRRLYTVEPAMQVIDPLRNIAALLQAAARRVILAKPPLIERTVESDACLRLLAHRWYGDHTRAPELLRLNPQLRTPYAIPQGEVLHAYAV